MRVLFIARGGIEWASSRLRAFWVAEAMGADIITHTHAETAGVSPDYDVYILQKCGGVNVVRALKETGARVFFDICDPMHWYSPKIMRPVFAEVDGIVASNKGLADDLAQWAGREVVTIPDRLKLSHYPRRRNHKKVRPVRFIWFGSAQNRNSIFGALANLMRLAYSGVSVELTVYDDRPDMPIEYGPRCPVMYARWSLAQENEVLSNHDVALLPPYPGPWGAIKSNNKALTAYAAGLPVTDGFDITQMAMFIDNPHLRQMVSNEGRRSLKEHYTIDKSAADWWRLLGVDHTPTYSDAILEAA